MRRSTFTVAGQLRQQSLPHTVSFLPDGTINDTDLVVVNLHASRRWNVVCVILVYWWYHIRVYLCLTTQIAEWRANRALSLAGITWPGNSSTPPTGKPIRFRMKVVTQEEEPFVIFSRPEVLSGRCPSGTMRVKLAKQPDQHRFKNITFI